MRSIKLNISVRILAIVLLGTVLAFLAHQQTAHGQADGVLPWIVNTTPAHGAELPVNQGITFTFNTPMNRASVEV